MRKLITGIYLLWAFRSGPCLHPFYCCQLPPGERWLPVSRRTARTLAAWAIVALWYAFCFAVLAFMAWLVAHGVR